MNSVSRGAGKNRATPQPVDLARSENASPQFRLIQGMHESFAKTLSEVLSSLLGCETSALFSGIRLTTAGDFQSSLATPTCLITLRLHPERERMVLAMDSSTVLGLLDMLLGGGGNAPPAPRELTEIEWSLLEEISRALVRALGESWQSFKPVEFVVEALGNDPAMMPCPSPSIPHLRIAFTLVFGGQDGQFQIAVPCSFFDAIVPAPKTQEGEPALPQFDLERNAQLLEDAELEIEVYLEGTRLSFGELLALRAGQVVRFDHGLNEPLRGVVNGEVSLTGHILSSGRKRAFQIEESASK